MAVERQAGHAGSMLELYRSALRIRRVHPGLGSGPMRWLESSKGVLAFERDNGIVVVVNVEGAAVALPKHRRVLLASSPFEASRLPPNSAAWLEV
jgi:alpha-glucosidase